VKSIKAYLQSNGKIYYNEHFGYFTKTRNLTKMILLPTREIIKDFMLNWGLAESDVIDMRKA